MDMKSPQGGSAARNNLMGTTSNFATVDHSRSPIKTFPTDVSAATLTNKIKLAATKLDPGYFEETGVSKEKSQINFPQLLITPHEN